MSIGAQLTLFVISLVAIILGVSITGALGLSAVDLKTREIDQKWLVATAMLAEIADRISEYRIAEGYRALASGPEGRAEAELLANDHRLAIERL